MKFKRTLSIIIALMLVMMTGTTAFAEEKSVNTAMTSIDESTVKVSKEEAKSIAQKALKNLMDTEIDENKAQFRAELIQDYYLIGDYVWEIGWTISDSNSNIDATVTINANSGVICGLRKYDYSSYANQPQVTKITREQAQKSAEAFLDKVNPEIRKNSKYVEDQNVFGYKYGAGQPVNYNFQYTRMINGIDFPDNTVSVEINGATGKVVSFNYSWRDNINAPSTDGIIDSTKAFEMFKASGDFELMYLAHRNPYYYEESPKDVKLVYNRVSKDGYAIDAKDGKYITFPSTGNIVDLTQQEKEEFLKKASEVKKLDKELDQSGAESIIKNILADFGYDGYTIENLRFSNNQMYGSARGKNAWECQFMKNDSAGRYPDMGNISIDASTGQIINLSSNYFSEGIISQNDIKFSYNECYKKAIEFIAKYYPDKINNIKTQQTQYENVYYNNGVKTINPRYYFSFVRTVNGIQYGENNITVSIDARNNKVLELNCGWDDKAVFPDAKNTITKEEAQKIFYETYKPVLSYSLINKNADNLKPDMEVKLVYTLRTDKVFNYSQFVNAFSGKFVDYNGEEVKKTVNDFMEKIKGNPLEKELTILVYQGVIDTDNFELNKQITKIDLIKALVNLRGYNLYLIRDTDALKFTDISKDSDDYKYLQLAVRYGIIENKAATFSASQKITREELAAYLVKLTNYEKLAGAKEIFTLPYKDVKSISADKYGYIAILKGLGIMDGSKGLFRPKDYATMTEMADAIYKLMEYIKPLYY